VNRPVPLVLTVLTAEVVARLNQDWSADVAAYDRIHATR
jgi:hypothetical protein